MAIRTTQLPKMQRFFVPLLLAAFLLCLPFSACAANQPPNGTVTLIHPTDNAIDDLLQAGDASIDDSSTPSGKIIAEAESGAATLTQRRAAAREPAFRNALTLLHNALQKPIHPVYKSGEDPTAFSAPIRRLTRLLAVEQYVLLSEGEIPAALDSFADSLALSDLVQSWNLMGVLTGDTCAKIAIKMLSKHLDQLSDRDCARLFALTTRELKAPDPVLAGIHGELETTQFFFLEFLSEQDTTAARAAIEAELAKPNLSPTELARARDEKALLTLQEDPKTWATFGDALHGRLATRRDAAAYRLENYPSPAPPLDPLPETADDVTRLAEKAAADIWPTPTADGDTYTQNAVAARVRLQLLAVHAAIRRWRWEHNTVPPDLNALHLGTLATDPFTGQPLLYKALDGTQYTLSSAGAPAAKRVPLTL